MTAEVKIDGVKRVITLYVIHKQIINVDVLVGQNFTELQDVHYEKSDTALIFSDRKSTSVLNTSVTRIFMKLNQANVNIGVQ